MTISDMENGKHVCECGAESSVQIMPVAIAPMFTPYRCPVTDVPITTKRAHDENLKKHGCRVLETGETEQAKRVRMEADLQLDKSVEATTEAFVENLSGDQRSQLANEVASGLDVGFQRQTRQ